MLKYSLNELFLTWASSMGWTLYFIFLIKIFSQNMDRVAEWSALLAETGKRGGSSSIPTEVQTFFGNLNQYWIKF